MACMEARCTACPWVKLSNEEFSSCPQCGGLVMNYFDEPEGDVMLEDEDD